MSEQINNIFVEVPNRNTYEEYKEEINPNSLVFIKDESKVLGNGSEYQFVDAIGKVTLISNKGYSITEVPILKRIEYPIQNQYYDDYYYSEEMMLGDWDTLVPDGKLLVTVGV